MSPKKNQTVAEPKLTLVAIRESKGFDSAPEDGRAGFPASAQEYP